MSQPTSFDQVWENRRIFKSCCAQCGRETESVVQEHPSERAVVLQMRCDPCATQGVFVEDETDHEGRIELLPNGAKTTLAPDWLLEYADKLAHLVAAGRDGRFLREMITGRGHEERIEVPRWNALARLLPSVKLTFREDSGLFRPARYTAQALWDAFAEHLLACGWWLEMGVPVCAAQLAGTRALWRLSKTLRTPAAVAAALPAMQQKLAQLEAIPREAIES